MFGPKKNAPTTKPVSIQFDKSCYTLILSQVNDAHTNAEALWQKRYTAYPDICEKNTANKSYRLREALEENTATRHYHNKEIKRDRPKKLIYNDVLVWLPQMVVERELRQKTGALNALATNLAFYHNDRFQAQLLNYRTARYAILASKLLAENEVGFQFGAACYVADTDEQPDSLLTAIYMDERGEPHAFTPQISYYVTHRAADNRVYPAQENLFVIKPGQHPCLDLPYSAWFSDICSYVQLQRKPEGWQALVDSGGSSIKIATQGHNQVWLFEFSDSSTITSNGQTPRLQLYLRPIAHANTEDETTARASADDANNRHKPYPKAANKEKVSHHQAWGLTVIPDIEKTQSYKTIIPGAGSEPLLILEGLALPRIDGSRRVRGLKSWVIWFDEAGNIVDGQDDIDRTQLAALSANDHAASAYFRLPGQTEFRPITPGTKLYFGDQQADVSVSPVKDYYHQLVMLINPINFVLQENGRYTLGRRSSEAIPEIDLGLLNDPLGMEWANGSATQGNPLSTLCLSRSHLCFSLESERLKLTVEANKQPVYILNADLSLKETLQSKTQTSEGALMPNEYLLLGSFLLRFSL